MAIERSGARVRAESIRPDSLRCNAPQREPRFRDTPWGRPRKKTGWSLRELAERTGINIGVLSRIETSGVTTPKHAATLTAVYDAAIGTEWRA